MRRANFALADFGSPYLLDAEKIDEILQLGVAPNRIDLLLHPGGSSRLRFDDAWARRIEVPYGGAPANWIGLDALIAIKSGIDDPRHQDDARVLRQVRAGR